GQGCNTAVLIDFSKYLHHILEIDPGRRVARVEPGCVLDHLRETASEQHGLTFGPDPSTHAYCTLGGMLGNNSCGRHSVQSEFHGPGPRVADNLVELEVLTYRGERLRIGRGGAGVPDAIADRLRALADANAHEPISIEGMDDTLIEDMTLLGIHQHERSMLPEGRGWLLVEFGGDTKDESDAKARELMRDLEKDGVQPSGMKLYDDSDSEQHIW